MLGYILSSMFHLEEEVTFLTEADLRFFHFKKVGIAVSAYLQERT